MWDGGVDLLTSSGHLVWDGGGVLLESLDIWCGMVVVFYWNLWTSGVGWWCYGMAISRGSALITTRIIKVTYCMYIIVIHGVECTI